MKLNKSKLFIFNPACEYAIANGNVGWQPNKTLMQFEKDLEYLPVLFAGINDYIAVHQQPSLIFTQWLNQLGLNQPEYILRKNLIRELSERQRYPQELHPWGWSPAMHHWLKPLKAYTSAKFQLSPSAHWNHYHNKHYSRSNSLNILQYIVNNYPEEQLLPDYYHPEIVKTEEGVAKYFKKWEQIVLKAPWSSSGRGVQMLRYGYLNESNSQWIRSVIKQQGYVMTEPLLKKITDFSMHFHVSPAKTTFLGTGCFETNANGQYLGNIINPQRLHIEEVIDINELRQMIIEAFRALKIPKQYEGYAGVDLMVVEIAGEKYIHPCVEVNWRYNMGLVTLQLENFIHSHAKGSYRIHMDTQMPFKIFHASMVDKYPLITQNGKVKQGYLPLSDPEYAISGSYLLLK